AAHQLADPALRHVARKRHRALRAIDRKHGPHHIVVRTGGIVDAQRKQERGAGQALAVLSEVTLVKIERRLAVELKQNVAARAGDPPVRPELVPAAGTAMPDPDRVAIEADRRADLVSRLAIGTAPRRPPS